MENKIDEQPVDILEHNPHIEKSSLFRNDEGAISGTKILLMVPVVLLLLWGGRDLINMQPMTWELGVPLTVLVIGGFVNRMDSRRSWNLAARLKSLSISSQGISLDLSDSHLSDRHPTNGETNHKFNNSDIPPDSE